MCGNSYYVSKKNIPRHSLITNTDLKAFLIIVFFPFAVTLRVKKNNENHVKKKPLVLNSTEKSF